MNIPENLQYTKEHEWIKIENDVALIGITDYAQDQLGEIVFTELPEAGEEFARGDTFGVVESVKSVSDVFVPLAGKIVEVNNPIIDSPEILNEDPYGEGWMIKTSIADSSDLDNLLSPAEYEAYVKEEAE